MKPQRSTTGEPDVSYLVGMGYQDLASAVNSLERAKSRKLCMLFPSVKTDWPEETQRTHSLGGRQGQIIL